MAAGARTYGRNLVGIGLLAVAAATLTACAAAPAMQKSAATLAPSASSAQVSTAADCLLGANGADVEVGIGSPTNSCARWIQSLAGNGLVWAPISQMVPPGQPGSADQEAMTQACDLTDGTQELYVEDAGGLSYGNSICNQEEQNGWTPESSPGPLAARTQQAGQQQARAQASASTAASQQQAISQAQQQLQNDITTLESDFSSLNSNTQLASDVNQMKSDYQTEQNDYQTEQSDYQEGGCTQEGGDADTVGGDADTVGGDQDSLNGDIQSIQSGVSGIQSDIQAVQSDRAQLSSDGVSPAQDPSTALAAGQKAISNANAAIQWATQQGDAINSESQQFATTAQNYASQRSC